MVPRLTDTLTHARTHSAAVAQSHRATTGTPIRGRLEKEPKAQDPGAGLRPVAAVPGCQPRSSHTLHDGASHTALAGAESPQLRGSRAEPAPADPLGQAALARVLTCQPAPAGSEPLRGRPGGARGRGCAIPSLARPGPRPGCASAGPAGSRPCAPRPGPRSAELRALGSGLPAAYCLSWVPPAAGPGGGGAPGTSGAGAWPRNSGAGTPVATPPSRRCAARPAVPGHCACVLFAFGA